MWDISSTAAPANHAAATALLQSSSGGSVALPAEMLPAGETYVFTLTVANTMGGESAPSHRTIRKEAWPLVSVSIDGEASRELATAEGHVLAGGISLPELWCIEGLDRSKSLGLQLAWHISPAVAAGVLTTHYPLLASE